MSEGLSPQDAALVDLSAALAADWTDLEGWLRRAVGADIAPEVVDEVLLQSYLFLGYPACLEAFAQWRALGFRGSAMFGRSDWEAWRHRGERVCRRVYGGQYGRLRDNVVALHPELDEWMVVEGYGKVLGRPGLDLRTRELCVVALLSVLGAPETTPLPHERGSSGGYEPRPAG